MTSQANETTPDELMEAFRGRSLNSIIAFTVVVHAAVLFGTSVPFLWKTFAGADTSKLSEEKRVELAMKEATASLREIAEEHGLKPQDLSSRFAGGAPRATKPAGPDPAKAPRTGTPADPDQPKSAIEKELEKVEPGPTVPPVENDEEEDLFK